MVGWSCRARRAAGGGARRNGWLLAPLVAEIVAACVTGAMLAYGARLDPARFGDDMNGFWFSDEQQAIRDGC
jgi:glycine oxidase